MLYRIRSFGAVLQSRYTIAEAGAGVARVLGVLVLSGVLFLSGSVGAPRGSIVRYRVVMVGPGPVRPRVSLDKLAGRWVPALREASARYGVPPRLLAAVIHEENRGFINRCAHRVSPDGAIGPMQLMPGTAWNDLRVNPWNPRDNINGGARYLARMIRRYHGNVRMGLIAYNEGPSTLTRGIIRHAAARYADDILRNDGDVRGVIERMPRPLFHQMHSLVMVGDEQ